MRVVTNMTLKEIVESLSTKATPITEKEAKELRQMCRNWQSGHTFGALSRNVSVRDILSYADKIMRGCGTESCFLRKDGRKLRCEYVNTGDSFNVTVLYWNSKIRIGCWGDLAERYQDAGNC